MLLNNWPPKIGMYILVNNGSHNFHGKVKCFIDNDTAAILTLKNRHYYDHNIALNYSLSPYGHFILLPSMKWEIYSRGGDDNNLLLQPKRSSNSRNNNDTINNAQNATGLYDTIYNNNDFNVKGNLDRYLLNEGKPNLNYLFTDDQYIPDVYITDEIDNYCSYPNASSMEEIRTSLLRENKIEPSDIGTAVSVELAVNNVINSENDELGEGKKIISWLNDRFTDDFFSYLGGARLSYHIKNGYVHIFRQGCSVHDVIGEDLFSNDMNSQTLQYLDWQYGRPIDKNTLKYIINQNKFQQGLVQDNEQIVEAKLVLSQEYTIALQPDPRYQMWLVQYLILCWHADKRLLQNIRYMKVLINQYRCKSDEDYNKKYGTLASIIIYPLYGINSFRMVLSVLDQYLLFYQSLGWVKSTPTFYTAINPLLWWSNGPWDIKEYSRHVKYNSNDSIDHKKVFSQKMTNISGSYNPFDVLDKMDDM